MKTLFYLLCGLLYLVGQCFGWTYQEASVYICIYLWPLLCILSTLPIAVGLVQRIVVGKDRWLSICALFLAYLYTACYIFFFSHVLTPQFDDDTVEGQFSKCVEYLQRIAAACNITYEEANIIIYVELFALIITVNGILAYIAKPYHRLWEKFTNKIRKRRNTPLLLENNLQ